MSQLDKDKMNQYKKHFFSPNEQQQTANKKNHI